MTGGVVDAVAKAIFQADDMASKPGFAWGDTTAASYRAMATAAIEALGLTPEFAHMGQPGPDEDPQLDEWSCGHEIITPGKNYGVVHEGYDEPVQRVVSPWVSVVRGATQ